MKIAESEKPYQSEAMYSGLEKRNEISIAGVVRK